jgi:PTS system mannitol-specific IIC component
MGPFAGWVIKRFDKFMETRMPAGFEMLINNFSVGIIGMLVAILGYYVIGPVMTVILGILTAGVDVLISHSLLPLAAIFIEPAKVLFLNNAINHGIFTPIGAEQVKTAGQSIMYMLEANPGPGLGVLLAYWAFAKDKATKDSAPGAIIIHFFGGIHEIYFPYVLMNPIIIIAPIVGNICAITWFSITGCGLKGPASPGSIIAFMAMAPKNKMLLIAIGVLIAAAVSFAIASIIVKATNTTASIEEAQAEVAERKAQAKGAVTVNETEAVRKVVFACDAGMGSSAMGATKFRNRIKASRPDITVTNTSVDNIPSDCDIAVVQTKLQDRAKASAPQAQLVTIDNFLNDPALDSLYLQLTTLDKPAEAPADDADDKAADMSEKEEKKDVLGRESILLNQPSVTKEEAIRKAGELLVARGSVEPDYVDAMQERERLISTYMGMGIAIPHGTTQAKGSVKKTAISLVQYPEGVDFGEEKAQLVFGIAGIGDEHLDLLAKIAGCLEDAEVLEKMKTTDDIDWILEKLS